MAITMGKSLGIAPQPETGPVVGWLCNYTPVEIFHALGLRPHRVLGNFQTPTHVDAVLHGNVCPYIRNCLDLALRGEYDFLDAVVVNNTCMAMSALYEYWKSKVGTGLVHLLQVPREISATGEEFYAQAIEETIAALSKHFGTPYRESALLEAIHKQNEIKLLLKQLSTRTADEVAPFSVGRLQTAIEEGFSETQESFTKKLQGLLAEPVEGRAGRGAKRVLITGAHSINPDMTRIVEDQGLQVVYDDLCTGARLFDDQLCPTDGDPVRALAKTYLHQPKCARMNDSAARHERLVGLVKNLRVDGVLCYLNRYCCSFAYDFPLLRRRLNEASVPSLMIEGDYTANTSEQIRTRVQAFAELLEMR